MWQTSAWKVEWNFIPHTHVYVQLKGSCGFHITLVPFFKQPAQLWHRSPQSSLSLILFPPSGYGIPHQLFWPKFTWPQPMAHSLVMEQMSWGQGWGGVTVAAQGLGLWGLSSVRLSGKVGQVKSWGFCFVVFEVPGCRSCFYSIFILEN